MFAEWNPAISCDWARWGRSGDGRHLPRRDQSAGARRRSSFEPGQGVIPLTKA